MPMMRMGTGNRSQPYIAENLVLFCNSIAENASRLNEVFTN